MKQEKLLITMKDMQKYKVLKDVIDKKLTGIQAAELLNFNPVHISRLKQKLLREGFEGLLRKTNPSPPVKISGQIINEIIRLRKEIYYDFNIMHFMDKLHEIHNMAYSYESIRQILIHANEHYPRKKKKIHRQRRRMPKAGMLIQMDSSQHYWLPLVENKWWLIVMIDDATNEVSYAHFFPKDTTFANMHVIRRFIEIKGIFMSLYVDKASHFKTTRHGGLHYSISQEQDDTQIERCLEELGINIIPANSPQAKGRIEVTFRLFQDRLIKEMRLAGIKSYDHANKFLIENFLPWYNTKYTHEAENAYMPVPNDKNLDLIFCIKKERTVNNDNTLQIYGHTIQILPSPVKRTFAKSKVDVCLFEDNQIFVLHKGLIIAQSILSKNNKLIKKEKQIERLLNEREYISIPKIKPSENHPWRTLRFKNSKFIKKLNLTFSLGNKLTY